MLGRVARRAVAAAAAPRRALHPTRVVRAEAEAGSAAAPNTSATKINLRFVTPNSVLYAEKKAKFADNQVDMVVVPSSDGYTGFCPQHVQTVALLQPGVVSVHSKDDKGTETVQRFFVSGGFAIMKPDSTLSITAVEAVTVDQLDPDAVKEGIARFQEEMDKAQDPKDKALAQIGVEVHTTMNWALEAAGSSA